MTSEHVDVPTVSLREFWLLLDRYDWESLRRKREEGVQLSRAWQVKYNPVYSRIAVIAETSDAHSQLAGDFEDAMMSFQRKPPMPV